MQTLQPPLRAWLIPLCWPLVMYFFLVSPPRLPLQGLGRIKSRIKRILHSHSQTFHIEKRPAATSSWRNRCTLKAENAELESRISPQAIAPSRHHPDGQPIEHNAAPDAPECFLLRTLETSWGSIALECIGGVLVACNLPRIDNQPDKTFELTGYGGDVYSSYAAAVLNGQPPGELPPLRMNGTAFQKTVWCAMLSISRGQMLSYGGLAKSAGRPKACRAVANACGANPLSLFVPCHRVVSGAGLGGFSSGLPWKRLLLEKEQKQLSRYNRA